MGSRQGETREAFNWAESRQMEVEWHAWGAVCAELEARLGKGTVNHGDQNSLVHALKRWGEELAKLRQLQAPQVLEDALNDVRRDYPRLAASIPGKGWVLQP